MNSNLNSIHLGQVRGSYIPEIQGLRGIAVLLVVLFHADILLAGGFIGVDIFFVISGFVITKLLIREIRSGQPKIIRRFFLGRFYRLFPASAVVVLFTLFVSTIALSPLDGIQSVTSVSRYTSFFIGNIGLLQSGSGYFFSVNPLEHLWSLGVEAQFYIIFPIILLLVYKYSRRWKQTNLVFVSLIAVMIFGSLLFASVGSRVFSQVFNISARDFSFYMMPSRAWEFLLGTIVAVIPNNKLLKKSIFRLSALLIGMGVLAGSAILFKNQNSFPSFLSLLPALGASVVICFFNQSVIVVKILRSKLLMFIGNISYSWYLWHWPFIVFAKALYPTTQHVALLFGLASLGPAWLSYWFIETRFKFKNDFSGKRVVAFAACCIVLPLSASYLIDGFRVDLIKYITDAPALEDLRFSVVNQCQHVVYLESDGCFKATTDSDHRVVLFGDSHAATASNGVIEAAKMAGSDIGVVTFDGCPPFPISNRLDGCSVARKTYEQTLDVLHPEVVVLVNSLEHYLQYDSEQNMETAFIVGSQAKYVTSMTANHIRVVIVLQVPNMKVYGQPSLLRKRSSTSTSNLDDQRTRSDLIGQLRSAIGSDPLVFFVETDEIFCKNQLCDPRVNGELIYRDQSHLNPLGSMKFAAPVAAALRP